MTLDSVKLLFFWQEVYVLKDKDNVILDCKNYSHTLGNVRKTF